MQDEQTLHDELKERLNGFFLNSDLFIVNLETPSFCSIPEEVDDMIEQIFDVLCIPERLQKMPLKTWINKFHQKMVKYDD